VIVRDGSAIIGAMIRRDSVPERAIKQAQRVDRIALSGPVLDELLAVSERPKLARFIAPEARAEVLAGILERAAFFTPTVTVTDWRDAKDNIDLELALSAGAHTIVSGDTDLLVLHPWRGIRILTPAAYLALPPPAPADSPA
jgi:putative PIN family toxin of toxin-antitoxin system